MPANQMRPGLDHAEPSADIARGDVLAAKPATAQVATATAAQRLAHVAQDPAGEGTDPALRAHLQQLLQHRWDPLIIIALQDGPARFTQIAQHVSATAGARVADGVLTKALRRLQDRDLVVRLPDVGNTFAYNLTGVGYAVAPVINEVVQAIAAAAESGIC